MKKPVLIGVVVVLLLMMSMTDVLSQCPMCRMTVESNLKLGGSAGKGLNAGILYMLSMPYIMVMGIGYLWWKNKK